MEKYRWYRRKRAYYWSELFYLPGNISTRGYSSFGLARPQVGEDFLRSIHPHLSLLDQDLSHAVDSLADGPDCRRHVARMERHVPALNAFGRQRSEGREVLRQPDRGDHLREFLRRLHPEEPDIRLRGRMDRGGAADQADRHRHFDCPNEISVAVSLPRREGAVPAGLPRRISVGTGLDGPPVVPGRHDDRVDAVHDSFVVRRAPERVGVRERVRLEDSLDDVLSRDVLGPDRIFREHGPGADETPHREVRDDPEVDAAARPLLDVRRDRLRHRVHGVRPHRVAAVHNQVGDHHVSPLRVHDPDLDVPVLELSERSDDLPAILGGLLVETRYLGTLHGGTARRRRLSGHKGIARRLTSRGGSRSSGRTRFRSRPASRSLCRSDPYPR